MDDGMTELETILNSKIKFSARSGYPRRYDKTEGVG